IASQQKLDHFRDLNSWISEATS
ncbi:hypothetical protein A2U01_0063484, partial [Trifolium medium]|nr:hypothetical protein [Trifolium medium]